MSGSFADSNTLLYFASEEPRKADIAEALLDEGLTISVQVLNEMSNVLRRWHWDWNTTRHFLGVIRDQVTIVPPTIATHHIGLHMAQRHQLNVYDGMIVAAALLADCDVLYSEDMHAGLLVEDRLRIVNPFANA
jgi:predicted nucleic acid-binding protein